MLAKSKKKCALSVALSAASAGLEDSLKGENCQLMYINGCDCEHFLTLNTCALYCVI